MLQSSLTLSCLRPRACFHFLPHQKIKKICKHCVQGTGTIMTLTRLIHNDRLYLKERGQNKQQNAIKSCEMGVWGKHRNKRIKLDKGMFLLDSRDTLLWGFSRRKHFRKVERNQKRHTNLKPSQHRMIRDKK